MDRDSFRRGLRAGVPFAAASFLLSLSFGVLARETGFSPVAALAMSALVFAGSAQFAAVSILAGGGGAGAAIAAAGLMNSRFLPMGIALAPSLPGPRWWRAAQGQAVVDSSWALALQPDGTFNRWVLFGTTAPQYVAWLTGTAAGVWCGRLLPDPASIGLDSVYPAFFLAILAPELRKQSAMGVALGGAAIALVLVPITPPGVPVLAAGLAALWGLRGSAAGSADGSEAA